MYTQLFDAMFRCGRYSYSTAASVIAAVSRYLRQPSLFARTRYGAGFLRRWFSSHHASRGDAIERAESYTKDSSSNNLNSSCCDKLLAGAQAVVPFTMKLVPLEGQFSKLFVRHLEPGFVGILVQLGANVEPCFGGRAADQIDHDLAADQGASAPVVGDVAEHPMFDRVPLAGSGWKVTDLDLDAELIGQLLQLAFPQADPISVATATIRRNQHAAGLGIAWMTHFFPPAPDAFDGEFGGVVIDPNADPPLIGGDIVDAVGRDLAEVRINEIIDANFLRLYFWLPFLATVLEIADQFLLLGVD